MKSTWLMVRLDTAVEVTLDDLMNDVEDALEASLSDDVIDFDVCLPEESIP